VKSKPAEQGKEAVGELEGKEKHELAMQTIVMTGGGDCTVDPNTFEANECQILNYQFHLIVM
jgi:hypothetical protein